MAKTENMHTTALAEALRENDMPYKAFDITAQTYELLVRKRNIAILHRSCFEKEGFGEWFDLLMTQTECVKDGYERFKEVMARYIYIAGKQSFAKRPT